GKEIEYVGASLKEPSSPPPPSCVAPFLWRSAPFLRQASPPISSRSGFSRIRFSSFEHFPNLAGELERCEWFRNKRRTTSKARTQPSSSEYAEKILTTQKTRGVKTRGACAHSRTLIYVLNCTWRYNLRRLAMTLAIS